MVHPTSKIDASIRSAMYIAQQESESLFGAGYFSGGQTWMGIEKQCIVKQLQKDDDPKGVQNSTNEDREKRESEG